MGPETTTELANHIKCSELANTVVVIKRADGATERRDELVEPNDNAIH